MSTEITVEPTTKTESERDLAPLSTGQELGKKADNRFISAFPSKSENLDITRHRDKSGKPLRDFVSKGERIHNELTYRGVDWVMNSAFGVAFAYVTHRTKLGRKIFSEPAEKLFTTIFKPVVDTVSRGKGNENALKKSVEYGVTFLSIMFGGTVTIPPVMYLENPKHKIPIIKTLDCWIYGKEKVENDPKFEKAYDEIKHQPKKDFKTGMNTRFIALAPLLALTVYEPTNNFLKKNFYDYISRGTKYLGRKLGLGKTEYWAKRSVENLPFKLTSSEFEAIDTLSREEFLKRAELTPKELKKFSALTQEEFSKEMVKVKEGSRNWPYLHDVIAFDFGLTIFYSFLHEIAYKLFAKKHDDKRHELENRKHQSAISKAKPMEISDSPILLETLQPPQLSAPATKVSHALRDEMKLTAPEASVNLNPA